MSMTPTRLGALLLAAALLGGACSDGGEQEAAENPKQAFDEAIEALGDYEGFTFVISLDVDPADLASEDTPEAVAEALAESSLTISFRNGATPEDAQAEVSVEIDGNEDAVQMRGVAGAVYARADVRELVETFEGDMAAIDAGVEQASAAGFDFARAVVDGEWVGVEGVDRLAQQLGLPQPTPDPEEAAAFADEVLGILGDNASVTSEGTDDVGAHLVATVPLKETARELLDALEGFGGGAAAGALPADALDEIPAADLPVDVWVDDGRLVQFELDFVAMARELGEEPPEDFGELVLRTTIDEFTGEVEAPEDFVEIDLQQILQGFFGAAAATTETLGGSGALSVPGNPDVVIPELGVACSDLETLAPGQIETFLQASGQPGALKKVKRACPGLL